MMSLFQAEVRKLLTVRSTHIISAIAFVLMVFLSFYINGYQGMMPSPDWLSHLFSDVSSTAVIFAAIVAVLLMGHEYRYNTIFYTLTSANSRGKVLVAKIITVTLYTIALFTVLSAVGVVAFFLGTMLSPNTENTVMAPVVTWRSVVMPLFYTVGFALFGLILISLFRSLIAAIAALFIWPTVEMMLGGLFKENVKFLPFTALEQVQTGAIWSVGKAMILVVVYMVAGWAVVWYLFYKRDAN